MDEVDSKLSRVDDTEDVIRRIKKKIKKLKQELDERITEKDEEI